MKSILTCFAFAALALGGNAIAESTEPYAVSIWSRVEFGHDGHATDIAVVDADRYPPALVENVRKRLAAARVPAPVLNGKSAILKSGVEMRFIVTPTDKGGTLRLDGISISPMPRKKYVPTYPDDLKQVGAWEGEVRGTCKVSPHGRCTAIDITPQPGMPENIRKFAKTNVELWEFEPQTLDGQPIEGDYDIRFELLAKDVKPQDFRDARKVR